MFKSLFLVASIATLALPAVAQTTTTVTTEPQPQAAPPPPPPPSGSTTQVVVNPNDPQPPPRTRVRVDNDASVSSVETVPNNRSPVAIIATDALYGGVAGALIGGGVTLIDQGHNWERDLMVGAGIGVLAGAAFGVYEVAAQPARVTRAAADRDPAASNAGTQLALVGTRF